MNTVMMRIKGEYPALVDEILDQLPPWIWSTETTTFLDPEIGGGQFVREVERRLREAGHSDDNIKNRVFGLTTNALALLYVQNKYKLVGQYIVGDFLAWKPDMTPDVILMNPPYQSGNGEKGGKHSLWRKFVGKGFSLLGKDGYIGVVCPGFPYESNDLGENFQDNTPVYLSNDASRYFPAVGSKFKAWVVKQGRHDLPFYVDGKTWEFGLTIDPTANPIVSSIHEKTNSDDTFICKQDKGYSSTQFKNDDTDYFAEPNKGATYPIRHASKIKICYVSRPTACHYKNKVMMTFSGYPDYSYFDASEMPISSCYGMSGYIEVNNKDEAENLIRIYQSKLYRLLINHGNQAGMRGVVDYTQPKVDLTRTWTNEELYAHFNLTPEEIEYVETNA